MAVEAVASVVIQKLTDLLARESVVSEKAVVAELRLMKAALEAKGGYFLDAESKWSDPAAKKWSQEYLNHLYRAEDAIETLALRSSKRTFALAFLKNRRICRKITKIRRRIELKRENPPGLEDKKRQQPGAVVDAVVDDPSFHSPLSRITEDEEFKEDDREVEDGRGGEPRVMTTVSFAADRNNQFKIVDDTNGDMAHLVSKLVDGTNQVFAIVGEKGSGKTSLARAVYGSRQVKERFKSCCAWITRSIGATTEHLLLMLLRQIRSEDDSGGGDGSIDSIRGRISALLKEKPYLIVLDDVESSGMWDELRSAFPDQDDDDQKGSKILLITTDKGLANCASIQSHVGKLDPDESWRLFLNKSGYVSGHDDKKHEILRVCNGLPLNIILLGSLLSTKKHEGWLWLLSGQRNWETSDLISLCYDDLPAHLKLCLIYMVLFPKEFDIPVRRLQRLWLAEGFVAMDRDVKDYFDNLVNRSLIQVSKLTSDGSPKRCRLLGSLHDHLIPKAEVMSLFHVHDAYSGAGCDVADPVCVRRLVESTDIKNCKLNPTKIASLRSYLSFNIKKKDIPATEVGKLLTNVLNNGKRLLRVLDLEGVYQPSLPDNLGDFFHLRYLGLRWTFLDTLPESVGSLYYLETLDIKHTYITTLPPFIWKMKHLKHLSANGIHLDLPRKSRGSLPPLMTLAGFCVDDTSFKKGSSLKSLVEIRELEITFQLSNSDELLDWISGLTAIQALRLRSKDRIGHPSSISLKPLSELKQLTHLYLLGKLPRLPVKDDFPPGLKVLTLAVSELTENPMPVLGKLPKLTSLRLLRNSYLGETMTCPEGGFKELRVLKLWMLKNLEVWDVKEGAMEKLKELNIRCCDKLTSIPWKLLRQIKELTLTNMRDVFIRQVQEETSVSPTINSYDFTPLPWET